MDMAVMDNDHGYGSGNYELRIAVMDMAFIDEDHDYGAAVIDQDTDND